jgi:hypothetical protein
MADLAAYMHLHVNYMHLHETVKIDPIASPTRDYGLAITPPVIGIGTPVVAG